MQNNNPKHFLSEEEFVQLRLELSKANLLSMICEDEEKPVAQEELPPGTEDLVDPAKVHVCFAVRQRETILQMLSGVTRRLPVLHDEMERKGFEEVFLCQQPSHRMPGGDSSWHPVRDSPFN